MTWHVTDSIDAYGEHVWDLLARRADRNTLALTQIANARSEAFRPGDEPTFAWWNRAGHTRGAVSLTPPYEMLLNVVPDDALEELVTTLRRNGTSIPGVNGAPSLATNFAELWTAGTSLPTVLARRMRLYGTGHPVLPEPAPSGRARHARQDDLDLIVGWIGECGRETRDRPIEARDIMRERIDGGLAWLWEDKDSTPTSLAVRRPPTAGVSRLGPVYTPPEHRRHGFGAAVTAVCTQHALDTDSTTAVLFTDVANPTSNAVYQQIGYRPLEDRVVLSFEP
jgi:GNAT superfamily N-acetyltransferase